MLAAERAEVMSRSTRWWSGPISMGAKYAVDAAFDVEMAQPQGLLGGAGALGGGGVGPEHGGVWWGLGEAGDFIADRVEDFGMAETGDEQADRALDGAGEEETRRKVPEPARRSMSPRLTNSRRRRSGRRTRDFESLGEFVFAGQTPVGTVLAGGYPALISWRMGRYFGAASIMLILQLIGRKCEFSLHERKGCPLIFVGKL